MKQILVLLAALACPALAAAQSAQLQFGSQPALEVQRLAPQLVAFAGGDVNFNNLVNGLAFGLPVTLTTLTAPGVTQVVTFTPSGTMSVTQIAQLLESARQSLIGRGIAPPSPRIPRRHRPREQRGSCRRHRPHRSPRPRPRPLRQHRRDPGPVRPGTPEESRHRPPRQDHRDRGPPQPGTASLPPRPRRRHRQPPQRRRPRARPRRPRGRSACRCRWCAMVAWP